MYGRNNLELGMIMKSIFFPQSKFAAPNFPAFFLHFDIDFEVFPQYVIFKTIFSVWRCQKTGEWVTDQSTFTKRSPHPKNKQEFLRKMSVDCVWKLRGSNQFQNLPTRWLIWVVNHTHLWSDSSLFESFHTSCLFGYIYDQNPSRMKFLDFLGFHQETQQIIHFILSHFR